MVVWTVLLVPLKEKCFQNFCQDFPKLAGVDSLTIAQSADFGHPTAQGLIAAAFKLFMK